MKTTSEVCAELLAEGHLQVDVDTVIDSFVAAVGTPDAWENEDVDILRQQLVAWEMNYLIDIEDSVEKVRTCVDLRTLDREQLISLKQQSDDYALVNLIDSLLQG